jgi:hypothetical protein
MTDEAQIIGVNLVGPPPIDELWIRLDDAVNVFYGPNGAGKSAILQGLRSAFSGLRGPGRTAQLLVHVPPTLPVTTYPFTLGERIARAVEQAGRTYSSKWPHGGYSDLGSTVAAGLWEWCLEGHESEDPLEGYPEASLRALLDDVVAQGLYFLISSGVTEPRWRVQVAARRDESTPAVNRAIAAMESWMRGTTPEGPSIDLLFETAE